MAVVVVNDRKEIMPSISMEAVNVTVTTSGDTYGSRFSKIRSVQISDRTTLGGARVSTISGGTITITCTNGDSCDLLIFGE